MGDILNTSVDRRVFVGFAAAGLASITAALSTLDALTASEAWAVTSKEKQAEADAVREQLVGLQSDLEAAEDEYWGHKNDQKKAEAARDAAQKKIEAAEKRIAELQDQLSDRARSMYRQGGLNELDFVLGATSFEDFATRLDYLNRFNEQDSKLIEESKSLKAELEETKAEHEKQAKLAEEKAAKAKEVEKAVQGKIAAAEALAAKLDEEAKKLLAKEQAEAARKAAEERRRKAAEERARRAAEAAARGEAPEDNGEDEDGMTPDVPDVASYGDVVTAALSRKGCPYVWGAEGPRAFDCSGLVTWAYRQIGIELPHQSEAQYNAATQRVPVSQARPGDVLWRYGHVGIAIANGGVRYVHAPTFGAYVRDTDDLSWSGFTHALRFG